MPVFSSRAASSIPFFYSSLRPSVSSFAVERIGFEPCGSGCTPDDRIHANTDVVQTEDGLEAGGARTNGAGDIQLQRHAGGSARSGLHRDRCLGTARELQDEQSLRRAGAGAGAPNVEAAAR